MSFWGKLFGSTKVMEDTVGAVINTGDALFYTDEEKAEYRQKVNVWLLDWMKVTNPQNLSRRLIALSLVWFWLGMQFFGVVAFAVELYLGFEPGVSDYCAKVARGMDTGVGLVLVFYFAPNKIGEAFRTAKGGGK